ncbi:MAG: hypothetical protein AAF692_07965 [Pseudomonadota bacterium]
MSTRISSLSLAALLLLAACAPESGAPQGLSVQCAFGEEASLGEDCVLESAGSGEFIIHHPDNSFQRVRFNSATGALSAADGADDILVDHDPAAGTYEFSIGNAHYRVERSAFAPPVS